MHTPLTLSPLLSSKTIHQSQLHHQVHPLIEYNQIKSNQTKERSMGICASCESTSVAATAKVILQDGRLQEFSYPVRVSYVLSKDPNCFLCNSDEMEFDVVVSAVRDDEELQPGQLYFALPLSKLQRPLHAEEMAALAVKANAALLSRARSHKCRTPVGFFAGDRSHKVAETVAKNVSRNRNRIRNGQRKMFAANLSIIPE